jgi:hypothetical protein
MSILAVWASFWFYFESSQDNESRDRARVCLSIAAIPLCLSLLRFLSIFKSTGKLVIMVFEILRSLGDFLMVLFVVIVGYGITFINLFPKNHFSTVSSTLLTLFDAAIGNHDFDIFKEETDFDKNVGIITMVSFVILMIILLNLLIARLSATHETIDGSSIEILSKVQARNVIEYMRIYERNSLNILPAPLNVVSSLTHLFFGFEACRKVSDKVIR